MAHGLNLDQGLTSAPALEDGVLNHWATVGKLIITIFFEMPTLCGTISSERNLKPQRNLTPGKQEKPQ